jgi:hypothetical protein
MRLLLVYGSPENARPLARPTTRTRHLAVAITQPTHLPRQRHWHPPPRQHRLRPNNLARCPVTRARELSATVSCLRPCD